MSELEKLREEIAILKHDEVAYRSTIEHLKERAEVAEKERDIANSNRDAARENFITMQLAAEVLLRRAILAESKEVVAWRYRRIGRPNKWIVTTNPELVAGLPAKGGHIIEPLCVTSK